MYYYKTKRLAVVLILSVCVAGGLYRSAHSLSFTPPEIHKTLLHGQIPEGWHAHYSRSSLQAVQNALTQKLHRYYNQEMGIRLYWEGLQPDYKITVDYTEKLDHSLSIRIQAQPRHGNKTKSGALHPDCLKRLLAELTRSRSPANLTAFSEATPSIIWMKLTESSDQEKTALHSEER